MSNLIEGYEFNILVNITWYTIGAVLGYTYIKDNRYVLDSIISDILRLINK